MVIEQSKREAMLQGMCNRSRKQALSSEDYYWIVAEYPEGYDVSAYNFYDMLDILNEEEGTEMPTIMKVFDNAYDAIMYRDDLHCKEEAEALIQCE